MLGCCVHLLFRIEASFALCSFASFRERRFMIGAVSKDWLFIESALEGFARKSTSILIH